MSYDNTFDQTRLNQLASQGVINIDGPRLSIEWLPKHEVEAMRHNDN